MKSTLDILTTLFRHLNPVVSPVIGRSVIIGSVSENNQEENVTINSLANTGEYLQDGLINVNIELMELRKGIANSARFKEIVDVIIPLIDDVSISHNGTSVQLWVEDDKGIFRSKEVEEKYFYNIRVRFKAL